MTITAATKVTRDTINEMLQHFPLMELVGGTHNRKIKNFLTNEEYSFGNFSKIEFYELIEECRKINTDVFTVYELETSIVKEAHSIRTKMMNTLPSLDIGSYVYVNELAKDTEELKKLCTKLRAIDKFTEYTKYGV